MAPHAQRLMVASLPEQFHVALVRLHVVDDFRASHAALTLAYHAQRMSSEKGFCEPLPSPAIASLGSCAAWLMGLALADLVAVRLHCSIVADWSRRVSESTYFNRRIVNVERMVHIFPTHQTCLHHGHLFDRSRLGRCPVACRFGVGDVPSEASVFR